MFSIPNFAPVGDESSLIGIQNKSADTQQKQLANAIAQVQLQYEPQNQQAGLSLKQAQAKRENTLANLPYGGHNLPGISGQVLGIQALGQMFGTNSPIYKQAMNAFQLEQQKQATLMAYQKKMTDTADRRMLTNFGKGFEEESDVAAGLSPSGKGRLGNEQDPNLPPRMQNQPLPQSDKIKNSIVNALGTQGATPGAPVNPNDVKRAPGISNIYTPEKAKDLYEMERLKKITDPKLRERIGYAINMTKTLNRINPDILTMYSGPQGQIDWAADQALDSNGKPPKRFLQYNKAIIDATVAAKQMRQYLQDSIQPAATEKLDKLTDPTTWYKSPERAKAEFMEFKDLIDSETETYEGMFNSVAGYKLPPKQQAQPSQFSDEDIQHTAQKYGISPEEVRAELNKKLGK